VGHALRHVREPREIHVDLWIRRRARTAVAANARVSGRAPKVDRRPFLNLQSRASMRIQRFPLEGETPPRLEVRWEGTTAHVFFDGERVASLHGASGLKSGWATQLPDGSTLEVRAIRRVLLPELSILRNGEHIASSPSHPHRMLSTSANMLIVLSLWMIIAGVVHIGGRNWVTATVGGFYLIGALFLRGRRRIGAVIVAIPMFLELDLLILAGLRSGISWRWAVDVLLTAIFGTFVLRSYQAARDSRRLASAGAAAT